MNILHKALRSLLLAAFCFPCAAMAASPAAPEPLARPYAPLMTLMGGPLQGRLGDEDIADIARTFQLVHGHGGMGERYWAGLSAGRDAKGRTVGERWANGSRR